MELVSTNTRCKIELLGELLLTLGGEAVTRFRTRKTAELLAYLACFRRHRHPREALVELLWPECDMDSGRHNLSMALSSLRQQGSGTETDSAGGSISFLVADRHAVGLYPDVSTDVAAFETALANAECAETEAARLAALQSAVEMYTGELLPGYYEDWIFPEQQRMAELFFRALRRLIAQLEAAGDPAAALPYALRAVRLDRLREDLHREVIRLYIAAGQTDAALRHYRELERLLHQECETSPDAETRAFVLSIPARPPKSAAPPQVKAPPAAAASLSNSAALSPTPDTRHAAFGISTPGSRTSHPASREAIGGAVPLDAQFYITRAADAEFHDALERGDSIVLVKGPRQAGKTSLLARGLQQARHSGARVILTHFQIFNASHLQSAETLLLALAETIAEQLDLDVIPSETWESRRGANLNFRRFLRREVLEKLDTPLVWGLDEVDRLFGCAFGSEIFALFRSWHDERALDPDGLWNRLTLAIAYATEAHLFITDLNQSPFNVGTRLTLQDFTIEQAGELNTRSGSPLRNDDELRRFFALVNGQPYLTRRGLDELARHRCDLAELEAEGDRDEGPFGDHLRRILSLLLKDTGLCDAVRTILAGNPCPTRESFHRLCSAGIMTGDTPADARPRCRLYANYLSQRLL